MNNDSLRIIMTVMIITVPFMFGEVAMLAIAYMAGIDLSPLMNIPIWQTTLTMFGCIFIAFLSMVASIGVFGGIMDRRNAAVLGNQREASQ